MKVSLFVHDLAGNPVVRAYPVAVGLERLGYEIEILGFLVSGDQVFAPYRDRYPMHTIRTSTHLHRLLLNAHKLANLATGDVIYAFKPLWTSFYPALLASGFGARKPLLLDVEDDELWVPEANWPAFVRARVVREWTSFDALKYKWLLHPLTRLSRGTTVVSRKLQRRYGGAIILHGTNEIEFNPTRPDLNPAACRSAFDLPSATPLILFAGTPHPHKGVRDIVAALMTPDMPFHLVLAGNPGIPEFEHARSHLGARCHSVGQVANERMPALLAAVDVVATPQRRSGYTEAQMPAKLLEAMAMGKAVIATAVGDLPLILGDGEGCPRGWIVPPQDPAALARALLEIAADPVQAKRRGEAARAYFLDNASTEATARRLQGVLSAARIAPASHGAAQAG
jgi:glycosyltransferase involved in cell wall biosynthesis